MHELSFEDFQTLLDPIDKIPLFDAVKPEWQRYARRILAKNTSLKDMGAAYQVTYQSIDKFCLGVDVAVDIDVERDVIGRMGKGTAGRGSNYSAGPIHAQKALYFFLFSENCESHIYAERICTKLFKKDFYDAFEKEMRRRGIPRPRHLPPAKIVDLGPLQISLGFDVNLTRLEIEEDEPAPLLPDGLPDVFAALTWRSRLTSLHGRKADFDDIEKWATDGDNRLKVMLISGPGGSGKTRLATSAVANLVHGHAWAGGFLHSITRPIDGAAAGVALLIDYPEEQTELVSEILRKSASAIKKGDQYERPVRLILVTREPSEAWTKIIGQPAPFNKEIRLEARPYLEFSDASAIADDVEFEYPKRIGRDECKFSGVEAWLERDAVHRLPLNILAASIHAVLEPDRAFELSGKEVLTALAEWELRRVRHYSERDLGDRDTLEKLLGLSLFTQSGLTKETIFRLGESGLCSGSSGNKVLESVCNTPFWVSKSDEQPSHLIRLEPDRPAAIFCLKALRLDDPSPGLPRWLAFSANQDTDGFGDRLSRLTFDIGHVDPRASRTLEQQCISMLRLRPDLIDRFQQIAYRNSSVFSAKFAADICRQLLTIEADPSIRVTLLQNQAAIFLDLRQPEAALIATYEAIEISRKLAATRPDAFSPSLPGAVGNFATALSELGYHEQALAMQGDVVAILRQLILEFPDVFQPDLAAALSNQANLLSKFGRYEEALAAIYEALEIDRQLAAAHPKRFQPDLASSLDNQANILSNLAKPEDALSANKEAVSIYRQLVTPHPDRFLPDLAMSLNNLANRLGEVESRETALIASEEAVSIFRQLLPGRPAAFEFGLANSLNTRAKTFSKVEQHDAALIDSEEAVLIYRKLAAARPESFLPELAKSLSIQADILSALRKFEEAVLISSESLSILRPFFLDKPNIYWDLMATTCGKYMLSCDAAMRDMDLDLLKPIMETFERNRKR